MSPSIHDEYRRVVAELADRHPSVEIGPVLDLITLHAQMVEEHEPSEPICRDPHDDKFIMCALAARAVLISGDRDLLAVDGFLGVEILTPRRFLTRMGR